MLKRSNTFRLVQTTMQQKSDYRADATIEKVVHAQVAGVELQKTSMDADVGSFPSWFIKSG